VVQGRWRPEHRLLADHEAAAPAPAMARLAEHLPEGPVALDPGGIAGGVAGGLARDRPCAAAGGRSPRGSSRRSCPGSRQEVADEPDLGLWRRVGRVPERVGIAVALALQGRERRGQHDRRVEGARPEGPDVGLAVVSSSRSRRESSPSSASRTARAEDGRNRRPGSARPAGSRAATSASTRGPHEERDHAVAVGIRAVRHRVPVDGEVRSARWRPVAGSTTSRPKWATSSASQSR